MPSPATHLRAPLLWLLFPLMAGLTAARLWPAPAIGLIIPAIGATALAGVALWLANREFSAVATCGHALSGDFPASVSRWRHLSWAVCLCAAVSSGGFVMLHFREPQLHQWETQPPRELTLTLRVDQLYPGAPQSRSISGIGKITAANGRDRELVGHRVYFSTLRKISVPPSRSGSYVMRGILEPLPREPAEASFNDYLENLGIRQTLTRARIIN